MEVQKSADIKLSGKFQKFQSSHCYLFNINGWWLVFFWTLWKTNEQKLRNVDYFKKLRDACGHTAPLFFSDKVLALLADNKTIFKQSQMYIKVNLRSSVKPNNK